MANEKIRVGVIGARWGEQALVAAVKSLPEMELAAVCTAHPETAEAMAARTGAPKAYGDYLKLVEDRDIDLIAVSVRPALHHPITKAALNTGKHVYCEWPGGLNLGQVEDLLALSRQKQLMTAVGLQARWSPVVMWFHRLMREGYVGDVLNFSFTQMMSQYNRPTPSARWWTTKEEEGGTALTLQGGAVFDLLSFIAGDPAELAASVDVRLKQWTWSDTKETVDVTAPDTVAVALRLKSGAVGTVTISRVSWQGSGQRLEIYGTKGSLQLGLVWNEAIKGRRLVLMGGKAGEPPKELPVPEELFFTPEMPSESQHYPVAQSFRQLGQAIRSKEPMEPDYRTAVRIHRILAAIDQASQERRWVSVDLPS